MIPTPLPLVEKSCGVEIEEMMPEVLSSRISLRNMLYFCLMLRRRGLAKLFLTGVPHEFFADLHRSGRAFLDYLTRQPHAEKCTGLSLPLFDLIVCGDFDGAKLIAEQSRRTHNAGEEYEEEFLYNSLLMQKFFLDGPAREQEAGMRRYAELTAESQEPRVEVCSALLRQDQAAFEEALVAMLRAQEECYQSGMDREEIDPDDAATTARLSIEGAAMVRLARLAGLRTANEYLLIPFMVLQGVRSRLPSPDSWKVVESYYELE